MDWKTEYIMYPFFRPSYFKTKYNLKKYDIDNYNRRLPKVLKQKLDIMKLSLNKTPEELKNIFTVAWKLYYERILNICLENITDEDIDKIIHIKNVSKNSEYSFLTSGKYLQILCSSKYETMKNKGYTNIYISQHVTYPGKLFFQAHHIFPIMFDQTQIKCISEIEIMKLIKHIIFNKHSQLKLFDDVEKKMMIYLCRYTENDFITTSFLIKNGCVYHLFKKCGTLTQIKQKIADECSQKLNLYNNTDDNNNWSSRKFYKLNNIAKFTKCKYCSSSSFDLHHLLPRNNYSDYTFKLQNVIPLCGNVHNFISRNKHDTEKYSKLCEKFINNNITDNSVFDVYLSELHKEIHN